MQLSRSLISRITLGISSVTPVSFSPVIFLKASGKETLDIKILSFISRSTSPALFLPDRSNLDPAIFWLESAAYRGQYRRAIQKKANLEVTGEEKPKTRLRKKADKRLCREKKPVCALPDEEKPVSLVSDEKKPICAVPGRKITTNGILRVRTLK